MRLLLDTNVVIWALLDDPSLTHEARAAIEETQNLVAVSAASVWEISIKHRVGKLRPRVEDVVGDLGRRFASLPITSEHAWAAGALPLHHRDPCKPEHGVGRKIEAGDVCRAPCWRCAW